VEAAELARVMMELAGNGDGDSSEALPPVRDPVTPSPVSPRAHAALGSSSKRLDGSSSGRSRGGGHEHQHQSSSSSSRSPRTAAVAASGEPDESDADLALKALAAAQAKSSTPPATASAAIVRRESAPPSQTDAAAAAAGEAEAALARRESAPPTQQVLTAAQSQSAVGGTPPNRSVESSPLTAVRARPTLQKTSGVKELFQKPQLAKNAIQIKAPEAKDVYMAGWLLKSRQKRWFILQGKSLFWFKLEQVMASADELRAKAQNELFIHRQRINAVDVPDGAKAFPIVIEPEDAEKEYEIVAPSQYLQTQWCDMLQMALRVKPTPDELARDAESKKASGMGNFRRMLFGRGRTESELDNTKGRDIGVVMAVAHTGHAAYDEKKGGFDTRGLPPQLQRLFDAVEQALARMGASGISADESRELLKMAAKDPTLLLKLSAEEEEAAAATDAGDDDEAPPPVPSAAEVEAARQREAAAKAEAARIKAEAKAKRRVEKELERQRRKIADLAERERKRKMKAMAMMTSIATAEQQKAAEAAAKAAEAPEEEEPSEHDVDDSTESESEEPPPAAAAAAAAPEATGGAAATGSLLAEIRNGATLRRVEVRDKAAPVANTGIGFMLASALLERRKAMLDAETTKAPSAVDDDWN
jgi:hypothetical protein